jgi:transposase
LYVVTPAESSSSTPGCDCLAHRFGNAADHPDRQPRYGSDMSDAEWAVVRQEFPTPAWMHSRDGRPEGYCHRQMVDAVRYLVDNGIKWRSMPADFLPFLWNLICQGGGISPTRRRRNRGAGSSRVLSTPQRRANSMPYVFLATQRS